MKITDINGLYEGYSKTDDFRILIAAHDKDEAQATADSYATDTKLGKMTVSELSEASLTKHFDCDYVVLAEDNNQ